MKTLKLLVMLMLVLFPLQAFGAGKVTVTTTDIVVGTSYIKIVKFANIGDSSGGTVPDTNVSGLAGWCIWKIQTVGNHGGTEPTQDAEVYIKDANAFDLLGGQGVDLLDNDANNETYAVIDDTAALQPIVGTITYDVDATSVNSATWDIYLYLKRCE